MAHHLFAEFNDIYKFAHGTEMSIVYFQEGNLLLYWLETSDCVQNVAKLHDRSPGHSSFVISSPFTLNSAVISTLHVHNA